MTRETPDEDAAIADVVDRLAERFPTLPRERIAAAVAESHARFEGAKVRDFVPVLIEREARALLEQPVAS
ncbi:three-helix bundle dimerization domain-containing protein [Microbacterium sp. SS28]|uniref:three-helix bundle dimerization domain-containing protein n=1 Tax=Microbacterium sp. SS28 TaxID=2919948 RepID=UPI001FA97B41|nr:hypothetical protein [Microbacterium sp. SS28]